MAGFNLGSYFKAPCSKVAKERAGHCEKGRINFGGGKTFCPKICARKINKMTEFYMIIARKIFVPIFYWGWGHLPPSPTLLEGRE